MVQLLDAAIPRGLLAGAAKLRTRHNLDSIGSRAPAAPDRFDVLGEHGAFIDLDLAGQGGMPELAGSNRANHIEAGEVAAVAAAKSRGLIRQGKGHITNLSGLSGLSGSLTPSIRHTPDLICSCDDLLDFRY